MSGGDDAGGAPADERARWFLDRHMDAPERWPVAGGEVAVVARRAPTRETGNEDAVAVFALGAARAVLALADGVGGIPGGEQASSLALHELGRALDRLEAPDAPLRSAILDGIENANRALLESGAGSTTIAVVEVDALRVRTYHAGDSLILLTGQRGRLKRQTIPHSPVGYAVESGLLPEDEAMVHDERHLIDNAVGSPDLRIEIGPPVALAPFDTLLVASDGLADNLTTAEIIERMRRGDLGRAAGRLLGDCRRRMDEPEPGAPSKPDDLSLVLFRPARPPRRRRAPDGDAAPAA